MPCRAYNVDPTLKAGGWRCKLAASKGCFAPWPFRTVGYECVRERECEGVCVRECGRESVCGGLCVRECAQVGPKFGGCVAKFAPHQALNNCVRQACHIGGTTIHSYSNIGIGAAPDDLVFPALSLAASVSLGISLCLCLTVSLSLSLARVLSLQIRLITPYRSSLSYLHMQLCAAVSRQACM